MRVMRSERGYWETGEVSGLQLAGAGCLLGSLTLILYHTSRHALSKMHKAPHASLRTIPWWGGSSQGVVRIEVP
jgi:hypothetical protein